MSPLSSRRALRGVKRSTEAFGVLWGADASPGFPLIVLCGARPASLGWLASSLAAKLPALVAVARVADASVERDVTAAARSVEALDRAISAAAHAALDRGADPSRLGLVAVGAAAPTALRVAVGRPTAEPIERLALVGPVLDASTTALELRAQFPTTLLQYSRGGPAAAGSSALARQLGGSGIAVRATDYQAIADAWPTRSRVVSGTQRAADDLVDFFARGFGAASTFDVIPGWDLH